MLYESVVYLDDLINPQMMVEQVAAQPYARYDHLQHLISVKLRNSLKCRKCEDGKYSKNLCTI